MFKVWNFIVFFLLCLVIGLLFNLKIQKILPHVKMPDGVTLAGMDGTVLQGRAEKLEINQFPLREITYRYMPSCIPLLKICYKIEYQRGNLQLAYDLLNSDTEVTDVDIEYRVRELNPILPKFPAQPVGRLQLMLDELLLIAGKPTALKGKLIWGDLGIDDTGIKFNIGDYQIDFIGDPEKYDFKIVSLDASLDVDGKGQLKADGSYKYEIRIESETGIDRQVKSVLDVVAARTGHNKYRVNQKGRLPAQLRQQLFE